MRDDADADAPADRLPEPPVVERERLPEPERAAERVLPPSAPMPAGDRSAPHAAPPPSLAASALRERIARFMAIPEPSALPAGFDEAQGDWQTIQQSDPFTQLYLDPSLSGVTAERAKLHHDLLAAFWQEKVDRLNQGTVAGPILRKYGGREQSKRVIVENRQRVEEAWRRLRDAESIQRERQRLADERRAAGFAALRPSMEVMVADDSFVRAESNLLFAKGLEMGLTEIEVAVFVESELRARDFLAAGIPTGHTLAMQIRSCDWHRRGHAPSQAHAQPPVQPIKIGAHQARSVAELIDTCDAEPDEARDSLFAGHIATWLGGALGETGLAKVAQKLARDRAARRNGLELFVRELCRSQGLPAEPELGLPAEIDFGAVAIGTEKSVVVHVESRTARRAWGTCAFVPPVDGLTVDPAFSIQQPEVRVSLQTMQVPPGMYQTELLIDVVGGRPRRIPVRFQVLAATLVVTPATLDFGAVAFGQSREERVTVKTAQGDAVLVTSFRLDAAGKMLSVIGEGQGQECSATVKLATRGARAGTKGKSVMHVITNVGTVDVPVSYSVRLARSLVVTAMVAGAVLGGALLGGLRYLLASSNPALDGWLTGVAVSGPMLKTGFGIGLGALLVGAVVFKIRRKG